MKTRLHPDTCDFAYASRRLGALLAVVVVALGAALVISPFAGCTPAFEPQQNRRQGGQTGRNELFNSFARNLNQLEQFENEQILVQTRDWLNRWVEREHPTVEWKRDELLSKLPADSMAADPLENLDRPRYDESDSRFLQEAIWLRDVARTAKGGEQNPLAIAERLFDWTVRNIQLEKTDSARWLSPGEIMLLGHGTPEERAWIFILLARQQRLDAVMLATVGKDGSPPRPWLPAVLIDKQLYLFDPELGLPIPGAKAGSIATLSDVRGDDGLLRKLDLDAKHPYRMTAERLKNVVVLVEAAPPYVSRRMKLVEAHLAGAQRVVLTTSPSTTAGRLAGGAEKIDVQVWTHPYEVEAQRVKLGLAAAGRFAPEVSLLHSRGPLWKGRVSHFKGKYDGAGGAKRWYMESRPSNAQLQSLREKPEDLLGPVLFRRLPPEERDRLMRQFGRRLYTPEDREAFPHHPERYIGPVLVRSLKPEAVEKYMTQSLKTMSEAKMHATYWLGLVACEERDYVSAIDYLDERTLKGHPGGPRTDGARYNLARAYEADGKLERAIALYEADTSPQSHGNRLRAQRLRASAAAARGTAEKPKTP